MRVSHQTKRVAQAFLDSPNAELHGFDIVRVTGLKSGTVYPLLQRLSDEGWLASRWEEIDEHAVGRRRRRYYRLTKLGEVRARMAVIEETDGLRRLMPGWAS